MQKKHLIKFNFIYDKKLLNKVGRERTYLSILKSIYDLLTATTILYDEKLKAFPLILDKTKMSTFTTFIQHSTESPSQRQNK